MEFLKSKAFLISAIAVLSLIVIFVIVLLIRNAYNKKHFEIGFYKRIYRIAVLNDYYLINHFFFNLNESGTAMIDHLLFGDKFIYIIKGKYYDGDISGKGDDKSLVFMHKNGKQFYTANPLLESKSLARGLSLSSGIESDFFIGITLVNDDCNVGVESNSKQFYIIQRKHLASLIKQIESRPLSKLNEMKLHTAVKTLDKMNKDYKKNEKIENNTKNE